MGLVVTSQPAVEPLSLAEAVAHLREDTAVLSDAEETLLSSFIVAARQWAENETRRALITQTLRYTLDEFPDEGIIALPRPNLLTVTSVTYVDTNGDTQTFSSSDYSTDVDALPGRILLDYGVDWPSTRCQPNAVTITYTAGYGATSASVPDCVKSAMRLVIGDLWENREAKQDVQLYENSAALRLLDSQRVVSFA